jgi:hypothetical protein
MTVAMLLENTLTAAIHGEDLLHANTGKLGEA